MKAARLPYEVTKNGSIYVRLVLPPELHPFSEGKKALWRRLGATRQEAKRNHARALASAQDERDLILAKKAKAEGLSDIKVARRFALMTLDQIAADHYRTALAFDQELRDTDPRYARFTLVDDERVDALHELKAGRGWEEEVQAVLGPFLDRYRAHGNTKAKPGTTEWRQLVRTLASADYEVQARIAERDEGDFTGVPQMPALLVDEEDPAPAISFSDIIDAEARVRSRGKDTEPLLPATEAKFRRHTKEFSAHRGSDNATTTTEAEVRAWMAALQEAGQRSNRTITDMLSSVRTVLSWGHQRFPDTLPALSVVKNVKALKAIKRESWTKTFTMAEAEKILATTRSETRPALRWVPWICAYSGARISEASSLTKADFYQVGGNWFFNLTEGGGRHVKTQGSLRRVPVHPAIIAEGFLDFMKAAPAGRLFIKTSGQRVGEWLRETVGITRPEVAPNHGWRHLFEDLCVLYEMSDGARRYLTGRGTGTSADQYGRSEALLPGLAREMQKIQPILAAKVSRNEEAA